MHAAFSNAGTRRLPPLALMRIPQLWELLNIDFFGLEAMPPQKLLVSPAVKVPASCIRS